MLTFSKCSIEDLPQLRTVSEITYKNTFDRFCSPKIMQSYLEDAFSPQKILSELQNPDSAFYFAYENTSLAGYIKVNECSAQTDFSDPSSLQLERIYLLQDFQGRGYGTALLEKAIELATQRGKQYLWLGVWEKNDHALSFYSRNGFHRFSEHIFRMGNEEQNDFLLKKEL